MAELPSLACPGCARPLEYHVTIEMLNPPIGKIDTGYCPGCARLYERVRQTGTFYESTLWPPLCRECRQPVAFAGVRTGEEQQAQFACRDHPGERWTWNAAADRWSRGD